MLKQNATKRAILAKKFLLVERLRANENGRTSQKLGVIKRISQGPKAVGNPQKI